MKFLLSVVVVLEIVFLISICGSVIDNAPDWVLLMPVVIGVIILIREILRKKVKLNNFGSGLPR